MSDWLLNLPVLWMAVVVFAATYLLAASIYWVVTRVAVDDRARAFEAVSPGMLPPSGILFALLIGFIAVEVWSNYDKAKGVLVDEADHFMRIAAGTWASVGLRSERAASSPNEGPRVQQHLPGPLRGKADALGGQVLLKFQLAIRLSASIDGRSSLPLPVSHVGVCVGSQANSPPSQPHCVGWRQWPHPIGRAGQQAGADGGSRTRTGSPPQDFKSCVSTSSTTSATV